MSGGAIFVPPQCGMDGSPAPVEGVYSPGNKDGSEVPSCSQYGLELDMLLWSVYALPKEVRYCTDGLVT